MVNVMRSRAIIPIRFLIRIFGMVIRIFLSSAMLLLISLLVRFGVICITLMFCVMVMTMVLLLTWKSLVSSLLLIHRSVLRSVKVDFMIGSTKIRILWRNGIPVYAKVVYLHTTRNGYCLPFNFVS